MISAVSNLSSSGSGDYSVVGGKASTMSDILPSGDKKAVILPDKKVDSKTTEVKTETSKSKISAEKTKSTTTSVTGKKELSEDEKLAVEALKKRDAEVRAHEGAHMAAGGGLVRGGASYSLQKGPDGNSYAIGGEVSIDLSPEKDPRATINKMQQVQQAALAPVDPSGQDRAVASMAAKISAQAQKEEQAINIEKAKTPKKSASSSNTSTNYPVNKVENAYIDSANSNAGKYIDALVIGSSSSKQNTFSTFA